MKKSLLLMQKTLKPLMHKPVQNAIKSGVVNRLRRFIHLIASSARTHHTDYTRSQREPPHYSYFIIDTGKSKEHCATC